MKESSKNFDREQQLNRVQASFFFATFFFGDHVALAVKMIEFAAVESSY